MMLTCERGEYLSTQGSSWSLWADLFSRQCEWGFELPAFTFLFPGLLGWALEQRTWLPLPIPVREKFSPGKSAKEGSTQRFSYYKYRQANIIIDWQGLTEIG